MTRTILNDAQKTDIALGLALAAVTLELTAAQYESSGIGPTKALRATANKYYELRALILDATAIELVKLPD